TVCTRDKASWLGSDQSGTLVLSAAGRTIQLAWTKLPERISLVRIDEFVVMPDHFHGIVWIVDGSMEPRTTLGSILRAFKSITTIEVNRMLYRSGPLWQRGYHDHVIRSEEDLFLRRRYIRENPVRRVL